MRKNIFLICISLLLAFPKVSNAQIKDLPFLGISYNIIRLKNDSTDGNSKRVFAFLNVPLLHADKRVIGLRLQYQNQTIHGVKYLLDQRLQYVDANIYWRRKITSNKWLHFFGQGGLYSDFRDISNKDYRYMLGGTYTVRHSDRLMTGWGASYSRQFFGNQINPFIAISYQMNYRWDLSGILPINPILTYRIDDHFSWVNEINGRVESYRLSATAFDNGFMQLKSWHGNSQMKYTVRHRHQFYLGIGYTFRQNIDYYNDATANDWKIITFNLSNKNKPVESTSVKGANFNIGYSLLF